MSNPKVSIIFPFHNCEKYIKEALFSLKYLTSKDFEIILVDDGSEDKSLDIAMEALRRFTIDFNLISRLHRRGCFEARTTAIEASRGEYVAIVDADDIIYRERLEKQLNFLEYHKNVWCCGGWADKIDQNGQRLGVMNYPPLTNKQIIHKIKSDPTSNPFIDPTTMFRKSVFYELGGYDLSEDRKLVADMDLWFRALLSGKVFVNMQEPLIKYRVNPVGNTRSNQKEMIRQHVAVRNEFIKGI